MRKKSSTRRHQKVYKMKGCSKRNHNGGSADANLAYTGHPVTNSQPNPHLAYMGKGGGELSPIPDVMNPNLPSNIYGGNPASANTSPYPLKNAYPATDPPYQPKAIISTNDGIMMKGGTCSLCNLTGGGKKMTGGTCPGQCGLIGGGTIDPQGLVGKPWTPAIGGWPGVDQIAGDRNYLDYNQYKVDPQTALISVGANRPFLFGGKSSKKGRKGGKWGKGGKERKGRKEGKGKRGKRSKTMKGGALSNLLPQDFLNLGRQIQYNMGSAYNAINGYAQPVNPMPWKDQLPRTPNLNTIRGSSI